MWSRRIGMCSKHHCQPAKPMNTQSVSSNIKYWCFSNLPQKRETKVWQLLIWLLSNVCYNFFKKNNTTEEKIALHLSNFFSFFGGCLLFALKLSFSKRDRKTDIQDIKAFFRRPGTHYGYCQEIIPNTHFEKGSSHKGKGSGRCQRTQVCFEAISVMFLMRHNCRSPIVCHRA